MAGQLEFSLRVVRTAGRQCHTPCLEKERRQVLPDFSPPPQQMPARTFASARREIGECQRQNNKICRVSVTIALPTSPFLFPEIKTSHLIIRPKVNVPDCPGP